MFIQNEVVRYCTSPLIIIYVAVQIFEQKPEVFFFKLLPNVGKLFTKVNKQSLIILAKLGYITLRHDKILNVEFC